MAGPGRRDWLSLPATRTPARNSLCSIKFFCAISWTDVEGHPPSPQVKQAVNPGSRWPQGDVFSSCYEWKGGRKCTRDVRLLIWPGEVWKIGSASEEPERRAVCSPEGSVCVSGDETAGGEAGRGGEGRRYQVEEAPAEKERRDSSASSG